MKIGVISDTHIVNCDGGLPPALREALRGVDMILHAGDIVCPEVLDELEKIAPVVAVWGNMDPPALRRSLPRKKVIEVEGVRIGVIHGNYLSRAEELQAQARGRWDIEGLHNYLRSQFDGVDVIVFGHLHRPETHWAEDALFLNPGAVSVYRPEDVSTIAWLTVENRTIKVEIVGLRRQIMARPGRQRASVNSSWRETKLSTVHINRSEASTFVEEEQGRRVTIEDVKNDPEVAALIARAAEQMDILGYTEHGERHATLVGNIAHNILLHLGYPERTAELAAIAGYLHDIGNVIHRENHAHSSALIAWEILRRLGMPLDEITLIMGAVGNHEEERGDPVSAVSAAVIIADKADVHRSRVQNPDPLAFDIHDRVNYAAQRSFVRVDAEKRTITLEVDIDTRISQVMEYFEIFMTRMLIARRAARFLDCEFQLIINGVRLM